MDEPKWLSHEEMRAWMAFVGATALLDRRLDYQLRTDSGISHLQYVILARASASSVIRTPSSGAAASLARITY
jgi:hypothetical protein